ncbi:MAG: UDP-N-acetylmuramoyl-L-alanine--D-glutamate ligase [Sedimentisphaerales bacterium]|jgi:UDP-N-acetylmuramoylalanine--D-glutamate ligase|nr:UDP-N-acetylmuramoyl-L-alanine--D-glutamate ligase [Sedimentisphaerales bacterium]HNY80884.1 UDP-N-acetylmuramoyl-L-alanine--D-glutamate ligase [Sedimentisphaerales bacterium]HOC63277.1 UDP-N-acetylmuramoyl-L-alanine--D-glutamate ligase [Sedimentisphaerales bacterium]HOH66782.1 UDP-N-acetylmuramoyl-L-alanine--D-glutamate ligase [Sedimentisphaerales bacterium]HPY51075.1 UDP-N-acetylmuramoyl-L-alanine--D-glutamate ligase [Sedimentisphaerales bacterium]
MKASDLAGKKILVMGLGRFGGGVDVVRYAAGAGAHVTVTDLASEAQLADSIRRLDTCSGIAFRLGLHDPDDFASADMVVANPAVKPDNRFLEVARRNGKIVTSQVGLFFQLCPARIVGITGANGKSTTTTLTAHLLRQAQSDRPYGNVWLSGNIGDQPLLTIVDRVGPNDVVVLELSSFQIEQLAELGEAPQIALLTNLTPNHLDRYGTFEAYCAAKEGLFRHQRLNGETPAISLFNAEDEVSAGWFDHYRGQSGRVCMKFSADDVPAKFRDVYRLPGRAYLSNLAGAVAIARNLGVRDESIEASLPQFQSLPHRLELVAEGHGVSWYNDSKATTPLSSIVALEAFDQPEILIVGGYDKHLPFDDLGRKIAQKAKVAILIGQTAPQIAQAIAAGSNGRSQARVEFARSLAEAVRTAHELASPGDVVLLSPACASYDMFENYQQRGHQFAELARGFAAEL